MSVDRECGSCGQKGRCKSIYYRLGHEEGPSVVSNVVVAFGVPILVFIIALTAVGQWLGGNSTQDSGAMLLSFIVALLMTALVVLGIWRVTGRPARPGGSRDEVQK